jgi:hypothetical protein
MLAVRKLHKKYHNIIIKSKGMFKNLLIFSFIFQTQSLIVDIQVLTNLFCPLLIKTRKVITLGKNFY